MLIIFTKSFPLDIWQRFEYASAVYWLEILKNFFCEVENEVREPDVFLQSASNWNLFSPLNDNMKCVVKITFLKNWK